MGSKKQRQRSKITKTAAQNPQNTTAIRANADNLAQKNNESPFLRLPREVRDKIYDEILIARLNTEDQSKYDHIVAATKTPHGSFGRENALDYYEQDICLMPGGNRPYPFIMQAMGLLLANKQIHEEANAILYSKNTFLILVEWERVYPFWRCERSGCFPPGSPCYVMFEYFKKIKHIYIMLQNTRSMADPLIATDSLNLTRNLETVARCFREGGNKLKTLKIRYTSCFDGQIDAMRDSLEGELPKDMPERHTILKDRHGKYHHVSRAEAAVKLFKYHKILDPLRALKGIAELVQIRGDLPGAYMQELRTVLSMPASKLGGIAKKKRETEEAERKKLQEQDKGSGFHAFMKGMAEKYKGTPSEKHYRDMLKVPAKSPAVMEELFKPPTKDELDRFSRQYPVHQATSSSAGSTASSGDSANGGFVEDEEVEDDVARSGIGMIDGKPVFGPPQLPGML